MSTVKYFHSAMVGAPVLNNTAGCLIALLDACLINGFGLKTLDSLVVSGGIATGTVSTGHSFEPDTIAEIAGATPAGLNGQKRILTVAGNSFTFDATGISNQTATGTISAKLAGAGWTKPFTGTNIAVYRSGNVVGTRMFLRVSDTGTGTNAFVRGFEFMSDAAGTGQVGFPAATVIGGEGLFAPKHNAISPTLARPWIVVADDRTFYVSTAPSTSATNSMSWVFGDINPVRAGDPFGCVLSGFLTDLSNTSTPNAADISNSNGTAAVGNLYMPRSFSGLGGQVTVLQRGESYWSTNGFSAGTNNQIAYPNPADNSLLLNRVVLIEPGLSVLRGTHRGLLHTPQNCQAFFEMRQKIDGQGAFAGRKLLYISSNGAGGGTRSSGFFLDITGPWS